MRSRMLHQLRLGQFAPIELQPDSLEGGPHRGQEFLARAGWARASASRHIRPGEPSRGAGPECRHDSQRSPGNGSSGSSTSTHCTARPGPLHFFRQRVLRHLHAQAKRDQAKVVGHRRRCRCRRGCASKSRFPGRPACPAALRAPSPDRSTADRRRCGPHRCRTRAACRSGRHRPTSASDACRELRAAGISALRRRRSWAATGRMWCRY